MDFVLDLNVQGKSHVAIREAEDRKLSLVKDYDNSYLMFLDFINSNKVWSQFKIEKLFGLEVLNVADNQSSQIGIPALPHDFCHCMVSSFGHTYSAGNDSGSALRSLDWFFKGNGSSLITSGQPLVSPNYAFSGGIEVEHACVYIIDRDRHPHYVGYTLANDFSDPLLRHTIPSLANMSKLRVTVLGGELVMDKIPQSSQIKVQVFRGSEVVWNKNGLIGQKHMSYQIDELEDLLFQHKDLCIPGFVHYVLVGAALSSDKECVKLCSGDLIKINSEIDKIELVNTYIQSDQQCY